MYGIVFKAQSIELSIGSRERYVANISVNVHLCTEKAFT